ncbi:hypothetical protein Ethha_2100 [Ethanoligenens harbinense YUAN-3]|uniref:Uncharacterized protein n=1 Tax=Ethanoligenens harbinense (strain DSM 18485 / JCM 12961 / CGMCC 1.5033 / YUAN-3) TaxID=663278 RepID=E6U3L7_ETHHY|nr:hypothetical protein Ethha_2100 [Ethanoligenens harbinense YUAN-3]
MYAALEQITPAGRKPACGGDAVHIKNPNITVSADAAAVVDTAVLGSQADAAAVVDTAVLGSQADAAAVVDTAVSGGRADAAAWAGAAGQAATGGVAGTTTR